MRKGLINIIVILIIYLLFRCSGVEGLKHNLIIIAAT